jgi:uncharacterized protein YpbB
MGFDHFHPCCNIDGRYSRLRFLVKELIDNEAKRVEVIPATGDDDITEGVRQTLPIMIEYRDIMNRLTMELEHGQTEGT